MQVWKYPLLVQEEQVIWMPEGAKVILLAMQGAVPTLWAMLDPEKVAVPRRIVLHGTGHEFDATGLEHLGSVVDGRFVWHYFEKV